MGLAQEQAEGSVEVTTREKCCVGPTMAQLNLLTMIYSQVAELGKEDVSRMSRESLLLADRHGATNALIGGLPWTSGEREGGHISLEQWLKAINGDSSYLPFPSLLFNPFFA